ncbi:MAG: HpsJ family protein [Cyanobacteriota bacterium]|jgi:cytochrome b561
MGQGSDIFADSELNEDQINDAEVLEERRLREWSDGARVIHWVGIVLLGIFLVSLFNAIPPRWTDPRWQLSIITLLMSNGINVLLGALLLCVALLFNPADSQIRKRTLLVRTLASWVAVGWLLLIPLQIFLGVRLINAQVSDELGQIQSLERTSRAIANSTNEQELRQSLAQIPNQSPLPRLTVTVEEAKANLIAQLQQNINTAKNRQQEASSSRWQIWLKEVIRNSLMSVLLATGFLAIGKNRQFVPPAASQSSRRRSRR